MTPSPSISEANNNTSMPSQQTAIVNFDEIKTLTTQNGGKKRPRIFSDAEFERRVSNIREYMDKEVKYHIIPHIPHNTKYLIKIVISLFYLFVKYLILGYRGMFIHLVPQHRILFKLSLRINGSTIRISHYQKQKHYNF